ncbi:MAG: hypothetical protein EPN97_16145 [Alphaproteobacteria bacterium]|nr:MAG: hypothetical protein EPN97_16145 [Alphaproteobacteria bacterium]
MTDNEKSKFTKVQLGTRRFPLPVWDKKSGKGGALIGARGALSFYTMRPDISRSGADAPVSDKDRIGADERIYAELMRNYPSRNMAEFLIHELQARDPSRSDWQNNSFISGYVGGPGVGKSFLFKLLGSLVHPKGNLYLNCKGVDVGSIFSETVFDTGSAMQERAAIDARIMQGNKGGKGLQPESIEILRNALGDAFTGTVTPSGETEIAINWDGLRVTGTTVQQQTYQTEIIAQTLRQVCSNEGIKMSEGGIQIGITTRDGIAIRAMDPSSADFGRPVLMDEINANSEDQGSLEKLFEFVAFLADPKVPSIELVGGKNRKMTFHRHDLPPTFRVNFTANPNARGMARGSFDRALMSRFGVQLDIRTVPDQDESDYADRIAGYLVGAPLMQIYHAGYDAATRGNIYDKSSELLKAAITHIYSMARTDEEKALLGSAPIELQNADIAPRIMQMANQLGTFFDRLGALLNPDSDFHKGGNLSPEYEAYLREIQIDLRLPTKLIEKAGAVEPEAETPSNIQDLARAFAGAFATEEAADEETEDFSDRMGDRGKRLESYILKWLKQVIVPADAGTRSIATSECQQLLKLALKEAADNGIGARELNDSARGGVASIASLYDLDRLENSSEQARIVRDALLQAAGSDMAKLLKGGARPDAILSLDDLMRLSKEAASLQPQAGQALIARTDADGIAENPFALGRLVDSINPKVKETDLPGVEELATYEGVMIPIAWPVIAAKTLNDIWGSVTAKKPSGSKSLSMQIAENGGDAGVGVTSLLVQRDGSPEIVHVLKGLGDTLVVSGPVSRDFNSLMKRQGIMHVDYTAKAAANTIDAFIEKTMLPTETVDAIKAAFLLRNGEDVRRSKDMKRSLGTIMTDVEHVPPVAPVYVAAAPLKAKRRR